MEYKILKKQPFNTILNQMNGYQNHILNLSQKQVLKEQKSQKSSNRKIYRSKSSIIFQIDQEKKEEIKTDSQQQLAYQKQNELKLIEKDQQNCKIKMKSSVHLSLNAISFQKENLNIRNKSQILKQSVTQNKANKCNQQISISKKNYVNSKKEISEQIPKSNKQIEFQQRIQKLQEFMISILKGNIILSKEKLKSCSCSARKCKGRWKDYQNRINQRPYSQNKLNQIKNKEKKNLNIKTFTKMLNKKELTSSKTISKQKNYLRIPLELKRPYLKLQTHYQPIIEYKKQNQVKATSTENNINQIKQRIRLKRLHL